MNTNRDEDIIVKSKQDKIDQIMISVYFYQFSGYVNYLLFLL